MGRRSQDGRKCPRCLGIAGAILKIEKTISSTKQNSRESFLSKLIVIQPAVNPAWFIEPLLFLRVPDTLNTLFLCYARPYIVTDSEMLLRCGITCIAKHRFVTSVVQGDRFVSTSMLFLN